MQPEPHVVWWQLIWSSFQRCHLQVIDAEMGRRKMLEDSPIASTNEDPVFFDTAQIPWWAWVKRFHLPEVSSSRLPCLDTGVNPGAPVHILWQGQDGDVQHAQRAQCGMHKLRAAPDCTPD
jgi:hypothetical protein